MKERSWVWLSKRERQQVQRLLQSGLQPVRTVLRALALRQLADGQPIRQVAKNVGLTPKTVWLTQPTLSARRAGAGLVGAATAGESHERVTTFSTYPAPGGNCIWS
jgi:hypothetical protein